MKKTRLIVALMLAIVMLIASCGTTEQTEAPETEEVKKVLNLGETGSFAYTVVRADEADAAYVSLVKSFKTNIADVFGSYVELATDYIYANNPLDPEAKEILVGDTNREQTAKVQEELQKAGGNRYGIYTDGFKVAVTGTDVTCTWLGLRKLMSDYVTTDASGKTTMEIPQNLLYISDELGDISFDFEETKSSGMSLAFYALDKVAGVPTIDDFGGLQGGGSDGTYAYYAMINTTTLEGRIFKYEIATWELVASSAALPTGHTNDITYDSVNKRLVISNCLESDGYTGTTIVDPETLTVVSSFQTAYTHRGVEYLPATNQYIFATGYVYQFTDDKFNLISSFLDASPEYTTQGLCCDSKYIYDVRWNSGATVQYIDVHSLDGTSYGMIPFYNTNSEPENIFRYGNEYFVGFNKTDSVYRVRLLPDNWF